MKKTLKLIAILLVIVMIGGMAASCSNSSNNDQQGSSSTSSGFLLPGGKDIYNDPIKIGVLSMSTAGVINRIFQLGINNQLREYPNITVTYWDAEYDPNRQITLMQEAITQDYDAVILEAMSPVALNDVITEAEDNGIVVLTVSASTPSTVYTMHFKGSDYSSGWACGEMADEATGGEGTALILDCPAGFKETARMGTGFQEYVEKNTNIKILEVIGIEDWSPNNSQTAMRDMLVKYGPGEITHIYCASDDIASGAINAIAAAGRESDGILIWGMMGQPAGLEGVRDGTMAGTMWSDVYTQYAVMFYYALFCIMTGFNSRVAGYTETPELDQPLLPVTTDNVLDIMGVSRYYGNH